MKKLISRNTLAGLVAGVALLLSACASQDKLKSEARVSESDARTTALSRVPGGTIQEGELEKEHGKLIWSFDIAKPGTKEITEVAVNAISGEVVSIQQESPESEAKEKAAEKK